MAVIKLMFFKEHSVIKYLTVKVSPIIFARNIYTPIQYGHGHSHVVQIGAVGFQKNN